MGTTEAARGRVVVQFLGDNDALKIIRDISRHAELKGKGNGRTSWTSTKNIRLTASCSEPEPDAHEETTNVLSKTPNALSVNCADKELIGQNLYVFRTPGRKRREHAAGSGRETPRATPDEPAKRPRNTPHRLKKRNAVRDDSDVESSSEPEDEGDADEVSCAETANHRDIAPPKAESTAETSFEGKGLDGVEDYFLAQASKPHTSDHTLARLDLPRMDHAALSSLLSGHRELYSKETAALYEEHRALFHRWMMHLSNGFNILLHGFGSKRRLIEDFRSTVCSDYLHVVVNGYFPSLTIRSILNTITSECLGCTESFTGLTEQAAFVHKWLVDEDADFFLLIHNIDGAMLRTESSQAVLSLLAQSPRVHVVASMDHINGPLIWDNMKLNRFNWLWFDCTTFERYSVETSYEDSLMMQSVGSLALSSLLHVVRSLTPNARTIFNFLVHYQLENENSGTYIGMPFQMLFRRCAENFVVHNDLTLRAQLTEFHDHRLIRSRKGHDGAEHIYILSTTKTLKDFLEQVDTV